jgi:hypothetical protein
LVPTFGIKPLSFRGSLKQRHQYQQEANDGSKRDYLARERRIMFLDLRLHKRIQSAVNLGHCYFLSATLIAWGASGVLLFRANRLRDHAKAVGARTWSGKDLAEFATQRLGEWPNHAEKPRRTPRI